MASSTTVHSPTRLVVVGATGDVGRGVVAEALARNWSVVAVARREHALRELSDEYPDAAITTLTGSVADAAGAAALVAALDLTEPTAVVMAISLPWMPRSVLETDFDDVARYWAAYLGAHLALAREMVPALTPGSMLIGIGGGMADFVAPGSAVVSMSQAAQRMLYRTLAAEIADTDIRVRELLIASKVQGHSNRGAGDGAWLTDAQIGARVCGIVAEPDSPSNAGPILKITPMR